MDSAARMYWSRRKGWRRPPRRRGQRQAHRSVMAMLLKKGIRSHNETARKEAVGGSSLDEMVQVSWRSSKDRESHPRSRLWQPLWSTGRRGTQNERAPYKTRLAKATVENGRGQVPCPGIMLANDKLDRDKLDCGRAIMEPCGSAVACSYFKRARLTLPAPIAGTSHLGSAALRLTRNRIRTLPSALRELLRTWGGGGYVRACTQVIFALWKRHCCA